MKNNTTPSKATQRPDIVQWYDKSVDRWLKIERVTGEVISQKVTPGEYKNVHIAKRRPSRKTVVKKNVATKKAAVKPKVETPAVVAKKKVSKKKAAAKPKPPKKPRKVNYLNNKDIMAEIKKSKEQDPPQMTDKLAHMLMTLVDRYGRKSNWVGYCVDEQTQCLTTEGWKSYDEVVVGETTLLSYDIDTECLVWSPVVDMYIGNFDGDMFSLRSKGLDALVTPGHKFVSKQRGLVDVEDLISTDQLVMMGNALPDVSTPTYDDAFVKAIGWMVTEGHYVVDTVNKRRIKIYQSNNVNPQYVEQIRECLNHANIHYVEHSTKNGELQEFSCTGELPTLVQDSLAPNRVLTTDFITKLTVKQRELLILTMIQADGWFRPCGGMSYGQKDKAHIDRFVMLCTLAGYRTSVSLSNNCYTVNLFKPDDKTNLVEHIDMNGGKTTPSGRREQKQNTPTVPYEGVVWCPTTMYGTFVCRRGKYVHVTGNSYNDDMKAFAIMMLVRTWKAFNPEKSNNPFAFFTQCIKNSFIQFLNQERRQRDIRDELYVDLGLDPSYTYQEKYAAGIIEQNEERKNSDDTVFLETPSSDAATGEQ